MFGAGIVDWLVNCAFLLPVYRTRAEQVLRGWARWDRLDQLTCPIEAAGPSAANRVFPANRRWAHQRPA
jgi:hypothetical protein